MQYKRTRKWWGLVFILAVVSLPAIAAIQTVDDIQVETVAQNPAAAQAKALSQARLKAVQQILQEKGMEDASLTPKQAEQATVFVDVLGEKSQNGRYSANFRVGVETERLSSFKKASFHIQEPTDEQPDWVLVIPVFRSASGTEVWSPRNAWIASWSKSLQQDGVDYVSIKGDSEDQAWLTTQTINRADPEALQHIAEKYEAEVIALVTLDTAFSSPAGGVVEVTLWMPGQKAMVMRQSIESASLIPSARTEALQILDLLTRHLYAPEEAHQQMQATHVSLPAEEVFHPFVSTSTVAVPSEVIPPQVRPVSSSAPSASTLPTLIEVPLRINLAGSLRWPQIKNRLESIRGLTLTPVIIKDTEAQVTGYYTGTREQLAERFQALGLMHNISPLSW